MTLRISVALATLLAAACVGPSQARAADVYRADYSVSLLGLKVATSEFETTVDHDSFGIKGGVHSAGLARIFEKVDGTTEVDGHIDGSGVEPVSYDVKYHYGKDRASRSIDFRNGKVVGTHIDPEPKKKPGWIDVSADDLKDVADPLTSILIPAASPRDVCGRTLRIYDGATRIDLELEFAGWQPFSTDGFKGTATSCRVRFIPVSGYSKGAFAMGYLSREKDMRIAFASLGSSGIYVPVFAKVGTQIGNVTVYATRFEKVAEPGQ